MDPSPSNGRWRSPAGAERRIPGWAQGIVAALARDQPKVVTRSDIDELLQETRGTRTADEAVSGLRRLGWLVHLGITGTWTFIPPGQAEVVDPYLGLRAWERVAQPGFHLCGANAAWFLGYLDRAPNGKVQILLPPGTAIPKGLRSAVSALRLPLFPERGAIEPAPKFLLSRRLDLVRWSDGLPCIGPEALLAQLAMRPASFVPWDDLLAHLGRLVEDVENARLAQLLQSASAAAWQRAAYLLHAGGSPERGIALFDAAPFERWPVTSFAIGATADDDGLWVPEYELIDRLVYPTQLQLGKA